MYGTERLMTVKEVAEYLRLDQLTIHRTTRRGAIPSFKVAGQWRFKRDLLEKWLDQILHENSRSVKRQEK